MDVLGVQKKVYKLSKLGEGWGGVRGNLDKIQKNSYFFVKSSLLSDADADNLMIVINAQTPDYRSASVLYLRQAAQ